MRGLLLAVLALLLGTAGALTAQVRPARAAGPDHAPPAARTNDSRNWSHHSGSHVGWYYSPLDQINETNVKTLGPAWFFTFDTTRGQEATPIVVDGVLYVTTAWSKVYAIDAKTGKQLWLFDPKVPGPSGYKSCCDVVNRGPAVSEGKVIISTIDGRLIALDMRTGRLIWSTRTVSEDGMYAVTAAPRVMHGKVFIGSGGGETGVRGYVSAYDANTGHLIWRFYTVPGDPRKGPDHAASDAALERLAVPTWKGQVFASGGGGAVWNDIATDPELNRIYVGTGNPFPWNPKFRSAGHGDNLFSSSIVALDADTGRYVWHYQEVPGDAWDYDATEDMILTDADIGGVPQHLLMQAAKDGYVYVLDRATGRLLMADPFVQGITWSNGVDLETGRPRVDTRAFYAEAPFVGSPGPAGAHTWKPSAYSPLTHLIYIPTLESSLRYASVDNYKFTEGVDDLGIAKGAPPTRSPATPPPEPPKPREYLVAWNTLTQKTQWRMPVEGGGGVLATGGGLVFQGGHRNNTAGELNAYRADTGERLWTYKTPNAILTGAIAYSVGGEQYIAVMSGAGGSADLFSRAPGKELMPDPGRLLVFKLGGSATLPPDPAEVPQPNSPEQSWAPEMVAAGATTYSRFCSRCHGAATNSRNVVPDLRRSAALSNKEAWQAIVIDGALQDAGMISWKRFLTPQDAENVRAYVASQTNSGK